MTQSSWPAQPMTVNWTYDNTGRQATGSWTIGGAGQNLVGGHTFTHAASSATETTTLSNGVIETVTYNKRMQPDRRRAEYGGIFWNLDYLYGNSAGKNNGNVIQIDDTSPGVTLKNQAFQYDYLNRLTRAESTGSWTQTFSYDRWGNRLTQTGPNALTLAYANNRITTTGYNSYDAAGNQLGVPGRSFQHDSANRVRTVDNGSAATYVYDGDGRRVKKVAAGETRWYYHDPSGAVALEYKQGALQPWDVRYFHFNGKLTALRSETDGLLWVHLDHLGTPRVKTTSSGQVRRNASNVEDRDWYYPYGQQINAPTDNVKKRFTGQERDLESGLDYFLARQYAPAMGRFTSVDPALKSASPANPQSWNRYAYALDNPLKYVDPDGESATLAGFVIGGAVGGAVAWYQGRDITNGILSGAVAGAVAGSVIDTGGTSLGVLAVAGAAGGASGGVVERSLNGQETTASDVARDAAVGAAGGLVLGGAGKVAASLGSKGSGVFGQRIGAIADKILKADRIGSGLKDDLYHRAASFLSKEQLKAGRVFLVQGKDGSQSTLLQTSGSLNGKSGIFEYILDSAGRVTHQRFIENGRITGYANQTVR